MVDRLRRVSECIGEILSLVGLRNALVSAIARLQDRFIDNLTNEYRRRHSLVDPRNIKESITIQLAVRAATTSSMGDN